MEIIGNAKIGLVLIGVMVAFFGAVVFLLLRISKKADTRARGIGMKASNMKTGQDFVPFADIYNDVADLGGRQYRVILEVSSLNYGLKSAEEQDVLENSYSALLNVLQSPFSIFVQNREIDLNAIVQNLRGDISRTVQQYPGLEAYGREYLKYISGLKVYTGCTKQKRKYLILSYDGTAKMTGYNENTRRACDIEQVKEQADIASDCLSSVGLASHMLTTTELIQLFYSINHRDDDAVADGIAEKQYFADLVVGGRGEAETPLDTAIRIIEETKNRFQVQVMTRALTPGQAETLRRITDRVFEQGLELKEYKKRGGMEALKSTDEQFGDGIVIEVGKAGHNNEE